MIAIVLFILFTMGPAASNLLFLLSLIVLSYNTVHCGQPHVSRVPLVGYSVDLSEISMIGDTMMETTGRMKPVFKADQVQRCLLDMRKETSQSSKIETIIATSKREFVDKLSASGSITFPIPFKLKIEIKGKYVDAKETTVEHKFVHRRQKITKGSVNLDSNCFVNEALFSKSFLLTVHELAGEGRSLPDVYFESERDIWLPYFNFFEGHGTHIITGAMYGFALDVSIALDKSHTRTENVFEAGIAVIIGPAKVGLEMSDNQVSERKITNLNVVISINGGGHQESVNLQKAADDMFNDPGRATKVADGDEQTAMKESPDVLGNYMKRIQDWSTSCANPKSDTSRAISATYTPWEEILQANFAGTYPKLLDNLQRATVVYGLLARRDGCDIGSWNERALECRENSYDGTVLGMRRYIKAANGKYAKYNAKTRALDLINDREEATEFVFNRDGDDTVTYSVIFQSDVRSDGWLALYLVNGAEGTFGVAAAKGDVEINGAFQFIVNNEGAIALVPSTTTKVGAGYIQLQQYMEQEGDRLVMTRMPIEPDSTNATQSAFFFVFEDPAMIFVEQRHGGVGYQGGRVNGKFNGFGTLTWGPMRNELHCYWVNNKCRGEGRMHLKETNVLYIGTFIDNVPMGKGKLSRPKPDPVEDGKSRAPIWLDETFEGEFQKGMLRAGRVILRHRDKSEIVYSDYFGELKDFKPHGSGRMMRPNGDGRIVECQWKDGKLAQTTKTCKMTWSKNGNEYIGNVMEDKYGDYIRTGGAHASFKDTGEKLPGFYEALTNPLQTDKHAGEWVDDTMRGAFMTVIKYGDTPVWSEVFFDKYGFKQGHRNMTGDHIVAKISENFWG